MTQMSNKIGTMSSKKEIRHVKFTEEEDSQLCNLVEQFGRNDWDNITRAMGGQRTKLQIRERWQNYLSPELVSSYTEAEDCVLVALYKQVGPQWSKIAAMIGKKSSISIRNRYRSLQSMKARGFKPDYQKMSMNAKIPQFAESSESAEPASSAELKGMTGMTEMNPVEPMMLEIPDLNFMMGDPLECEFEGFF